MDLTYNYHGQYCGPGWSDGEYQSSVCGETPPIDEFDQSCQVHDCAYYLGGDLTAADLSFAKQNIFKGTARTVAGVLVGAQGIMRAMTNMKTKNLRGANGGKQQKTKTANDNTRTAAPVAISTRKTAMQPKFKTKGKSVIISHRSLLRSITSSSSYSVFAVPCNPALAQSFPWLSKVAARYDEYRFLKLKYEFRSVCATSTAGVAMMSFDYDATDEAPPTKQAQSQIVPSTEDNLWKNNVLSVPGDGKFRFTRQGSVSNTDLKTMDYGNLFFSTIYGPNSVVGELYVEFEVELRKPTYRAPTSCTLVGPTTSTLTPFLNPQTSVGATISGTSQPIEVVDGTTIKFTVTGEFLVVFTVLTTAMTALSLPTTTASREVLVNGTINSSGSRGVIIFKTRASVGDTHNFASSITASGTVVCTAYITEAEYSTMLPV